MPLSPVKEVPPPRDIEMSTKLVKTKNAKNETILNGKYKLMHKLGEGSFAKVKYARRIDLESYEITIDHYAACKILSKPKLLSEKRMVPAPEPILPPSAVTEEKSFPLSRRRRQHKMMKFVTAMDDVM